MKALWTAASAMEAHQKQIDIISNNIANINTTGFKKNRADFKDILYTAMKTPLRFDGEGREVNINYGNGVKVGSTANIFFQGNLVESERSLDLAIYGQGFFTVGDHNGNIYRTRDGNFHLTPRADGNRLVTSQGYYVLDENLREITLNPDVDNIKVNEHGQIFYLQDDNNSIYMGRLNIVNFVNPSGLENAGNNLYVKTEASGEPVMDGTGDVRQGCLEASNVCLVEEMTNLMSAQRTYQINLRMLQTVDEMMGLANNMRR